MTQHDWPASTRRTSLAKLAREWETRVEVVRYTLRDMINWGAAQVTIDITRAAEHKVFELTSLEARLTDVDPEKARRTLRDLQEQAARSSGRPPADALAVARRYETIRAASSTIDGDDYRVGVYRYWRPTEDERRARTSRIIKRVQPGPYEDGQHLESLAREAAAIEMTIAPDPDGSWLGQLVSRVLLGTTDEPRSHAATGRRGDAVFIRLSAGLLDFLDLSALCFVLALKPSTPPPDAGSSFSARPEDTAAMLDEDPVVVNLLHNALAGWLCHGSISTDEVVAGNQGSRRFAGMVRWFAQRFVVAHEYGHALHLLGAPIPIDGESPRAKENRFDFNAAALVFRSARADRVQPNIALQGAVLAMKSQELIDRALILAYGGDESALEPLATHPPFLQRLQQIYDFYAEEIKGRSDPQLEPAALTVPADTVELIWERVKPKLQQSLEDRLLHQIWDTRLHPHQR
jgi:hypothetical protein